ncbi:MAG TPA: tRNA pseudouridine(38-40) synthase TruA [Opitutaceae bacterium]
MSESEVAAVVPTATPVGETEAAAAQRWKCTCAYDGTSFAGWQSQVGGTAIQDVLEARLAQIFKRLVRVHGSGRTDAGVHAREQVFHIDADWRHAPDKLLAALRTQLPPGLQVRTVRKVGKEFHARFSATGKRYDYFIHLGDADPFTRPYAWPIFKPLDLAAMQAAATVLVGTHDFRAFTALNGPEREDTVRDLRRLDVVKKGKRITITAEANGFMYKMVRSLVGALVSVGEGKLSVAQIRAILESKKRTPIVQTAPPQGLFLTKVYYRRGKGAGSVAPAAESDAAE